MQAAIYARVSTADQDLQRQLDEYREHIDSNYPDIEEGERFVMSDQGLAKDLGLLSALTIGVRT